MEEFIKAIQKGNYDKVKELIKNPEVDVNFKGFSVTKSVIQNDVKMLQLLIDNRADINIKQAMVNGINSLAVESIELLLNNGFNIDNNEYIQMLISGYEGFDIFCKSRDEYYEDIVQKYIHIFKLLHEHYPCELQPNELLSEVRRATSKSARNRSLPK